MAKGNRRTRVKFCGITRSEDAEAASQLGVDAVGFVFYSRSPRAISAEVAAKVSKCLSPFVTKVGLFVNADPKVVRATLKSVVSWIFCNFTAMKQKAIASNSTYPIRRRSAIRANQLRWPRSDHLGRHSEYCWILTRPVVTVVQVKRLIGTIFLSLNHPLILAGGLTPDNVASAIRQGRADGG